ncbi:hypothetical protein AB1Y20_003859 [Prymnesium parvum]|uniref:RING-type domain-containing protein n=1 Tax=Prymnesium parvum TaxID=97485 RepID=A0AB34J826_PRYPA
MALAGRWERARAAVAERTGGGDALQFQTTGVAARRGLTRSQLPHLAQTGAAAPREVRRVAARTSPPLSLQSFAPAERDSSWRDERSGRTRAHARALARGGYLIQGGGGGERWRRVSAAAPQSTRSPRDRRASTTSTPRYPSGGGRLHLSVHSFVLASGGSDDDSDDSGDELTVAALSRELQDARDRSSRELEEIRLPGGPFMIAHGLLGSDPSVELETANEMAMHDLELMRWRQRAGRRVDLAIERARRRAQLEASAASANSTLSEMRLLAEQADRALQALRQMRERSERLQLVLHSSRLELEHLFESEAEQRELDVAFALSRSPAGRGAAACEVPRGISVAMVQMAMPIQPYGALLSAQAHCDAHDGCPFLGGGDCPVCQDVLIPTDEVRVLPCRHVFHGTCIDPWFQRSALCPICRRAADKHAPEQGDELEIPTD